MKVAIVGQGYVGLPLAIAAATNGHEVLGFDLNKELVDSLNDGKSHVEDIDSKDLADLISAKKYRASFNPADLGESDIAIIAVPTPLDEDRQPDLSYIRYAAKLLGLNLKKSALIINESTSYPGTLREVIAAEIKSLAPEGIEQIYAISPERVDPGSEKWKIRNTPRLFSGLTKEAADKTRDFYASFCDNLIEVDTPEIAEAAKLFENTFRQVNIALVNEFALIMRAMNIPVHKVLDAASSKPYGFMKFNPGIGVGGHCIPVDPSYLAHSSESAGVTPRFINLANTVNLEMPKAIVERISKEIEGGLRGKNVLICGVAYKPNISDTRESPASILFTELELAGASVSWHDPLVEKWKGTSSTSLGNIQQDISIITVLHDSMDQKELRDSAKFVFDCTGKLKGIPTL